MLIKKLEKKHTILGSNWRDYNLPLFWTFKVDRVEFTTFFKILIVEFTTTFYMKAEEFTTNKKQNKRTRDSMVTSNNS